MTSDKLSKFWLLATFLLIIIIIVSSLIIWIRHDNGQLLAIVPPPAPTQPKIEINDNTNQKIDINRADTWLLQALPNIGEVRAQAIVDYRQQNGPFQTIEDLTRVPGISQSTFDKIKPFITINE
jgi:comEA protein